MYNWISPFNYDFAIAAIPIQIILIVFYGVRRNLPIRQSSCFWLIMVSNLVMTSADIVSCEMNEVWMNFPLWVMYAINHAYFLGFIVRGWALFAYTVESTRSYKNNKLFKTVTAIPAAFAVILILSTPWTSAIYTIAEDGYHNCALYKSIYFSTYFYIIVSLFLVIKNWVQLARRMKAGLLSFNLILLFGIIIRKQFYHMLVTSYFSILAILIIFLTSENPDLYREKRTRLMNKDALDLIGLDYWEKKVAFSLMTVSIHNYEESKSVYGISQTNVGLKAVASWLVKNYNWCYPFYTRNGNYILLMKGHLHENPEKIMEDWKAKYEEFQRNYYGPVQIKLSAMILPSTIITGQEVLAGDLARHAMANSYYENRRGNYIVSDKLIDEVKKQRSIEKAVKDGIADNRFEVYFQPIYSTKKGKVQGAEALARLNDPKLGFIPPLEFIPIAEKNGDIMEIGRQIFEKVCIFLQSVDVEELGIEFINVNLSPIQCMSHNLYHELSDIAMEHHVPMSMFDFEITESLVEDYEMIQMQIAGLQAMGAELSLDDFGTGSSNLTSLMNLPIHVVKVDMTFTESFFAGKAEFLPDLIRLFQNSNMQIVVEGIETKEMKDIIADLGCDYEQGYYFSKPIPPGEFVKYMEEVQRTHVYHKEEPKKGEDKSDLNNITREYAKLQKEVALLKEEANANKRIAELKESVSALLTNMPAVTFSKDVVTGKYLACNQAFADYANKETPDDVVGLTDFDIFDRDTAQHFSDDDKKALSMDKPYIFYEDVPDALGNQRKFQTTKLKFTDNTGRQCLLGLCQDVTDAMSIKREYVEKLAKVQDEANIDALTGIKNKHAYKDMEEKLNRRIEGKDISPFAISILDVNDLKKVNDTKGHQAGDDYIREACKIICRTFIHSPVYRVGGDEFAVISQGEDYERIDELIDVIANHNEKAMESDGLVLACGMSKFENDDCVVSVFMRADKNMYENKNHLKKDK